MYLSLSTSTEILQSKYKYMYKLVLAEYMYKANNIKHSDHTISNDK